MGIWAAIKQSLWFVRWNFIGAFGYIMTAFIILWVSTAQVWSLPNEESWFNLLAIMGHAFVSATILAGSYAFFQGRRQWLLARIEEMTTTMQVPQSSRQDPDDHQNGTEDQV
jgi:cytochrome bd-type quinol oxidase subunit 1